MKQKFYNLLLIFVLVFFSLCNVFAQNVSETKAKEVATSFLMQNKSQNTISSDFLSIRNYENNIVAYLYKLQPQGYIVVSAMQEITILY